MTVDQKMLGDGTARSKDGTSSGTLINLQLLRALAAFSVVVAHAIHETASLTSATVEPAGGRSVWNLGFGVDIFFVLSGFIMTHTAAAEFGKSGASARFFLRRCARVIPLYWLLTTALLLGSMVAPSLLSVPIGSVSHVLASYFFIPSGRGVMEEIRPVLALGWTLNYEMLFYVLFAVALLLPLRFGIIWLSALMLALALVGNLVNPQFVQIAFWTSPIILEFLFGVYVALIFRSGLRIGRGVALALLAIGLLGFVNVSAPWDDAALPQFLRSGVPAALLVLAGAIGPVPRAGRLVLWGVALGDASYSLYLAHPFILRPMRAIWEKTVGDDLPHGVFIFCASIAAAIVAVILYRLIEKPLTSYVQSFLPHARRKQRATAGAASVTDTKNA